MENEAFEIHQINSVSAQHSVFTLHMSIEHGTKLRNGKIIDSPPEDNTSALSVKAESNSTESVSNDKSDISSQLTEIK